MFVSIKLLISRLSKLNMHPIVKTRLKFCTTQVISKSVTMTTVNSNTHSKYAALPLSTHTHTQRTADLTRLTISRFTWSLQSGPAFYQDFFPANLLSFSILKAYLITIK